MKARTWLVALMFSFTLLCFLSLSQRPHSAVAADLRIETQGSTTIPTLQQTVNLTPIQDATLYESSDGSVANGAGPHFFVGVNQQNNVRRGLLQFAIAESIPDDATIISVTLHLNVSLAQGGSRTVSLHRVQSAWGEGTSDAGSPGGTGVPATTGDATWIHTLFNTSMWTTPGGDFAASASATQSVSGPGQYVWSTNSDLVTDVQTWLDTPAVNFGWLVQGDESSSSTAKRFDSRENATAANRPRLEIVYQSAVQNVFLPFVRR